MLTDFVVSRPKKIKVTEKKCGRPLMNIKLPTTAYLPPLEKACYVNQVPIRNYQKYESSQEFKVQLNLYLSKHPHLTFITFHRYGNQPAQIIFKNTSTGVQVAVLVKEFREFNPDHTGGYTSIAKSLDDIQQRR